MRVDQRVDLLGWMAVEMLGAARMQSVAHREKGEESVVHREEGEKQKHPIANCHLENCRGEKGEGGHNVDHHWIEADTDRVRRHGCDCAVAEND